MRGAGLKGWDESVEMKKECVRNGAFLKRGFS